MKKILSTFLATAMVLAMGVTSFAAAGNPGDIYEKNEDGQLEEFSGDLVPGKTYYLYVSEKDNKPSKVKVDYIFENLDKQKKVSLLSSTNLSVDRRKADDGEYYYFATMKLKDISTSNYTDGEMYLTIESVTAKDEDGNEISFDSGDILKPYLSEAVAYPSNEDISENTSYYEYDDETDTIDFENNNSYIEVDSTGVKTEFLLSCDTSYDAGFGNKYPTANLDFYRFHGTSARKAMKLYIEKENYSYLYERTAEGLKDITNVSGKYFVVRDNNLGSYVLSDTALPAVGTAVPTPPAVPETTVPGTQGPTGGIPFNPGTGAAI